jgi:hypothetical protein
MAKKKDWIQGVEKSMKKRGTEGAFTKEAKRHGKSVKAYATEVIKKYKGQKGLNMKQKRTLRRAVLARTFERMNK